jgi:hypothetical protein
VNTASQLLDRQIDDLLLEARGLALVRDLLVERGASAEELNAFGQQLDRVRRELAGRIAAAA